MAALDDLPTIWNGSSGYRIPKAECRFCSASFFFLKPRLLNCGHSCCKRCWKSQATPAEKNLVHTCGICGDRAVLLQGSKIPVNDALVRLIEAQDIWNDKNQLQSLLKKPENARNDALINLIWQLMSNLGFHDPRSSSSAPSSSAPGHDLPMLACPPSALTSHAIDPALIVKYSLTKYGYHVSCRSDRKISNQIGIVIYKAADVPDSFDFHLNGIHFKSGYIYMREATFVEGLPGSTLHARLFRQLTGLAGSKGWILTGFSLQLGKGLVNRSGTYNDVTSDWHIVPAAEKEITETETVWLTNAVHLYLNRGIQNFNPYKTICFDNPFTSAKAPSLPTR